MPRIDVIATTISGSISDWKKVERIIPLFKDHGYRDVRLIEVDSHEEARKAANASLKDGCRFPLSAGGSGVRPDTDLRRCRDRLSFFVDGGPGAARQLQSVHDARADVAIDYAPPGGDSAGKTDPVREDPAQQRDDPQGNVLGAEMEIHVNRERCLGCGCCMDGCFQGVLQLADDGETEYPRVGADPELCIACEECVALCPSEALGIL